MKKKRKKKIHKDKNGREFIKETYFWGGKMKFRKIYVIDGIPAHEFYEKNATDLEFFLNGDYELMRNETDSNRICNELNREDFDLNEDDFENDIALNDEDLEDDVNLNDGKDLDDNKDLDDLPF